MPISTRFQDLVNEVITQLKTITPEFADDTAAEGGPRVTKWMSSRTPRVGRYEAEVKAGNMEVIGGFTTKSTLNRFSIYVDMIYYSSEFEAGFDSAMAVAEKIYDKFHLTDIGGLSTHKTTVEINAGDGQFSNRSLLAIPIRVIIKSEQVITQN